MSESSSSKIKVPYGGVLIILLVVSILVKIAIIFFLYYWCRICDDTKICDFIVMCIITMVLILSVTVITVIFIAKILKPFAKMVFLKEIIHQEMNREYKGDNFENMEKERLTNSTDRIKKFCDILAEL